MAANQGPSLETTLEFPFVLTEEENIRGFNAYSNGNMDLFFENTKGTRDTKSTLYSHYRSTDGGKTWISKDTNWINAFAKKYGIRDSQIIKSVYIDENGGLYCVVDAGSYTINNTAEKSVDVFPSFKVLKNSNDAMVEIPNLTLKSSKVIWDQLIGLTDNGDLVLSGEPWNIEKNSPAVCIVNGQTGAIKAEHNISFVPRAYGNGKVIGYQYTSKKNPISHFCSADIKTGKESIKIPMDGKVGLTYYGLSIAKDGTIYSVNEKGLYKVTSTTSGFEQLLNASSCRVSGSNMNIRSVVASSDSKVYVLAQYHNYANEGDPLNGSKSKIYRYNIN